jgi:hypothetical protein
MYDVSVKGNGGSGYESFDYRGGSLTAEKLRAMGWGWEEENAPSGRPND